MSSLKNAQPLNFGSPESYFETISDSWKQQLIEIEAALEQAVSNDTPLEEIQELEKRVVVLKSILQPPPEEEMQGTPGTYVDSLDSWSRKKKP